MVLSIDDYTIGAFERSDLHKNNYRQIMGIKKGVGKGVEKGVGNLSDKQKIIIDLIKKYPYIAKKQMAEHEKLSKKSVEYNIDKLEEMGVLRHVGPTKGGYLEIIKKDL